MRFRQFGLIIGILLLTLALPSGAAEDHQSLAGQIMAANSAGSGAITLKGDIMLSSALPAITGQISIDGAGHSIDGGGEFRIFDVDGGNLTLRDITLGGGRAASGGAIRISNDATVTIENATLRGNIAETSGGALDVDGGSVSISGSHFEHNCAQTARHVVETARESASQQRDVDSYGCERVTYYWPSPDDVALPITGYGGAIRLMNGAQVTIEASFFSGNQATRGGVIAMTSAADELTILSSELARNFALQEAGALYVGGGRMRVAGGSFLGNSADSGGAILGGAGAIAIDNSAFHNNRASSSGGAISASGAEVTITHATMINSKASHVGGDAIDKSAGVLRLRNSIVMSPGGVDDCAGKLDQMAGNLSADGTCGLLQTEDALLDGPTGSPAHLPPLDHSPAVDAADPAFCLETDQLGRARPHGDGCDIGAIESTTALPAPVPIEPPPPCPLALKIIAANTDQPAGGCPAGSGHDIITLHEDITLKEPLPHISSDITIEGEGFTISGGDRYRIFSVNAGRLTINNLTLLDGKATRGLNESGGALRIEDQAHVIVNNVIFRGNESASGGAIGISSGASVLQVNGSSFIGNRAHQGGGAIATNSFRSRVSISQSSFVNNGIAMSFGTGGAIYALNTDTLEVSNSAFVNNVARKGGAIAARRAYVTLTHVTMYNNRGDGTGIHRETDPFGRYSGALRLRNSLIAGRGNQPDCQGRLTQNIGSFIADGSCSPKLSGDALLGEEGGMPMVVPLQPGSPAIDAAHASYCLSTDQLGHARPRSSLCDIGALEYRPVSRDINSCQVKTTHTLNFRATPGGERIGSVPEHATMPASARTHGWFQVEYRGTTGWISADYVKTDGDCE